jgi:hypothetical protein
MSKTFFILLLIPLAILIFVATAPIALRQIFPGSAGTNLTWKPVNKACFGVVVPQDIVPFILNERITFMDAREKKNECFGFDIYYGG